MIVYISIGNSDDKLTQEQWYDYIIEVIRTVSVGHIHGAWYSEPASKYQNACWCVEFKTSNDVYQAKEALKIIRGNYRQDSIAWAVAETEFI